MQNAIEASGLTKYYDDFLAVDHISFNVRARDKTCMLTSTKYYIQ